ncbi:hypothetical protein BLOT_012489 [Blomia tropicalis]|nr:hypothetical protein BLOT_012489 [Blomia tropicalis]
MGKLFQTILATFAIVIVANYGVFGEYKNNAFHFRTGKSLYMIDERISDLPISLNIPNYYKEYNNNNILTNPTHNGRNFGKLHRKPIVNKNNIESNSNLKKIMFHNAVLHNLHTSMIVLPYEFKYDDKNNKTKFTVNYATNKTYLTSDIVVELASSSPLNPNQNARTSYHMKIRMDIPIMFYYKLQQPYDHKSNMYYIFEVASNINIHSIVPKNLKIRMARNDTKNCYELIESYDEIKKRLMTFDYSFVRNVIQKQIKYELDSEQKLDIHYNWKEDHIEHGFENRVGTSIEDMDTWISDLPISINVPNFAVNYTNQMISKILFNNTVIYNLYTSMIKPYELHFISKQKNNTFTVQYETNKTYLTSDLTIEFGQRLKCFKKTVYHVQLFEEFQLNFQYDLEQPRNDRWDFYYTKNATTSNLIVDPLKPFNQRIMYAISNIDSDESECLDNNEAKIIQILQNTEYNATINVIKELLTEKMNTARVTYWDLVHTIYTY